MSVCGTCGVEITLCPECGGKICEEGCPDRIDDGCTCGDVEDDNE